jgi:hypothetical protein
VNEPSDAVRWLFDVDGTLIDGVTGRSLRPGARELLMALRDRGVAVLLWSAGGAEYAWRRAEDTGIGDLVDAAFDKRCWSTTCPRTSRRWARWSLCGDTSDRTRTTPDCSGCCVGSRALATDRRLVEEVSL